MTYRLLRRVLLASALTSISLSTTHAANVIGGEGPDNLVGTTQNDTIRGRGGNDTITGKGGNDIADGGEGDDVITTLSGKDQIFTGRGASQVNSGDGDDLVAVGTDMPIGEYGSQNFDVTKRVDVIDSSSGNDLVFIDNHDVEIGTDINGSTGLDRIVIGGSRQTYSYPDFTNNVWTTIRGFETWYLDAYYQLFDGSWTDKTQFATNTFPPYLAESGTPSTISVDGQLYAGAVVTDQNFDGVTGGRITIYTGRPAVDASAVTVGSVSVQTLAPGSFGDEFAIKAIGGAGNDEFIGADGTQPDIFKGNGGNDYCDGKDGVDTAIFSGNMADYSITEITYNSFYVQDLRPGSPDGTDTIIDVNTLKFADQSMDVVIRGLYLVGDGSNEQLTGGSESDYIDGAGGNDRLDGSNGNDTIIGGDGSDTVMADEGNDYVYGDSKSKTVRSTAAPAAAAAAASATDTIDYTRAKAAITVDLRSGTASSIRSGDAAKIGIDKLIGIENIRSGQFDDTLRGSSANNVIDGGRGRDTVILSGKKSQYTVVYDSKRKLYTVTDKTKGRDGKDTLLNVEVLRFTDGTQPLNSRSQPAASGD